MPPQIRAVFLAEPKMKLRANEKMVENDEWHDNWNVIQKGVYAEAKRIKLQNMEYVEFIKFDRTKRVY